MKRVGKVIEKLSKNNGRTKISFMSNGGWNTDCN